MISNYGFFWFFGFWFWWRDNNRRIGNLVGRIPPPTTGSEIALLAPASRRASWGASATSVELDAFIKARGGIVRAVLLLVDLSESGHKPHHADQEHGQQTMITSGLVWFGLVWFGLVWFGLVWFGLVWFGLVWFGLVWFDMYTSYLYFLHWENTVVKCGL